MGAVAPGAGAAPRDRELYEELSRFVLAGGLSWVVMERLLPATRAAMGDFRPEVVAQYGGAELDRAMSTDGVLRNAAKLEALVHNARAVVGLSEEHGSFQAWLATGRDDTWEDRVGALRARLSRVGERTAWRWLKAVGEPVPDRPPWEG